MTISQDLRFEFDVQGYLHLRGALPPDELAECIGWTEEAVARTDVATLNADDPSRLQNQMNRPLSRPLDADPRLARYLDHPSVEPLLTEFLGEGYRHIDNDLLYTYPDYKGGGWHRGVRARPNGHVVDGRFICPMVKVFYCLTDVGPGEGEFVLIPGSHKAAFEIDMDRVDLPAQRVFDDVRAGDVIIFDEGLLHNGRPNRSETTRRTLIVNLGREDAGVWPGYTPLPETLRAVTPRQRAILTNSSPIWTEPELAGAAP